MSRMIYLLIGASIAISTVIAAAQALPPLAAPKIQAPQIKSPQLQIPQLQAPQLQPLAAHYSADAANPGFQGSADAGGVVWQCAGGKCSANGPAATPTMQACSELARTVGTLRSFAYGQNALGPNTLGQCNAAVATVPKPGIGPLGMMPQGPMGAAPQALKPVSPTAPLMAMPELKPSAPVPGKAISLQASAVPMTPPATIPTPKPQQDDAQKPPQAAAPAPPPAGPFTPVAVRTPQLTLTGIGVAEISYRFTPVAIRTPRLMLTGTGVAEISYRFTPVAVRTPQLTLTGTGRSE